MPFDGVGFTPNQPLHKIDAVIDLLSTPDKWCKGALRSHDGRYCIRGAVRAVDGVELLEPAILQAIGDVAGKRYRRIEAFNDHPNTSHAQVLSVLQRSREQIATRGGAGPATPIVQNPASPRLASWRGTLVSWFAS